jgi:flavin-dependent dehydrogenase
MRLADQCDVLVVGAGPAGTTAAQLLASLGLVGRPRHRAASLSTHKLFAFLKQLDRIEAAGFYPNEGNVARWADASRVTRSGKAGGAGGATQRTRRCTWLSTLAKVSASP